MLVPGALNLSSTPYFFGQFSAPQKQLNNRVLPLYSAKVVGGSTAINGMFFDRGAAEDYDLWESFGNPGWNWKNLLGYFKKVLLHPLC